MNSYLHRWTALASRAVDRRSREQRGQTAFERAERVERHRWSRPASLNHPETIFQPAISVTEHHHSLSHLVRWLGEKAGDRFSSLNLSSDSSEGKMQGILLSLHRVDGDLYQRYDIFFKLEIKCGLVGHHSFWK
ncbi:unnamed protein product [Cuscuta epithymum]|uniref:Uncharacterized protein n=1 Tax=Cuscuta epithymum TaxID=186058 RepID=A0AAV0DHU8_9ASTE|nr:unnamed protein product [Cuscuta epithymum]